MSVPALVVADGLTGAVLLGSGALAWWRRRESRVGLLLVLAGGSWYAGSLVGSLVFLHRGPLVHLHVTYPTGRTHRTAFAAVVVLAYAAALYEGLLSSPWVTGALALLVGGAALHLYIRTSGPARKAGGPALAAAFSFALVLGLSSANVLLDLRHETLIAFAYDVVVCAIALGLTADLLLGRWTEATVADLVSQLSPETDAAGLQAALRRALDDPDLILGYWVEERSAYVDDAGQPLDLTTLGDQVVTEVREDGHLAAVLVHSATVAEDADLLEGGVAVARLAMGNARMRLEAEARVVQLAEARRRLVEVADEQRRALASELAGGRRPAPRRGGRPPRPGGGARRPRVARDARDAPDGDRAGPERGARAARRHPSPVPGEWRPAGRTRGAR